MNVRNSGDHAVDRAKAFSGLLPLAGDGRICRSGGEIKTQNPPGKILSEHGGRLLAQPLTATTLWQ